MRIGVVVEFDEDSPEDLARLIELKQSLKVHGEVFSEIARPKRNGKSQG
jgi:hypothetical protein